VRTTTAVSNGRAGLAYSGLPQSELLTGPVYLCGLRQDPQDRSNIALQNSGQPEQGSVRLRVTVFSADSLPAVQQVLPDVELAPGEFHQITEILNLISATTGYVRIERVEGAAPYYAYAVINDQANSVGSYVAPLRANIQGPKGFTLPVIVEANSFASELVLTNFSPYGMSLKLTYVAGANQTPDVSASIARLDLQAGEQLVLPNFIQTLREKAVPDVGPAGAGYAGALFVTVLPVIFPNAVFIGARTSAPGGGGRYGLFYTAVAYGDASTGSVWIHGLQQNAETRSNLALVNTGEASGETDVFELDIYNGQTGEKVRTVQGVTLEARKWRQFGSVLHEFAPGISQGYVRVTRTSGSNPFIAYAVINDGGEPGQRTGDGAFIASSP